MQHFTSLISAFFTFLQNGCDNNILLPSDNRLRRTNITLSATRKICLVWRAVLTLSNRTAKAIKDLTNSVTTHQGLERYAYFMVETMVCMIFFGVIEWKWSDYL